MNPHDTPTVTVIMPVYNAAKYLPDALDSLLAQTFQDFEIVAVNDGSTDDSARILAEYAAKGVRIRVVHRENGGCGAARNTGIALAKGRYIAQQDADDLSVPTRLEKQAAFLDSHPDICAAFCRTAIVDESLNPVVLSLTPFSDRRIRKMLVRRNGLQPNFMIRKDVMERVGGYREAFIYSQDYDFNLRVAAVGKLACVPEALYIYRTHDKQTSVAKKDEQNQFGTLARTFGYERKLCGRDSCEDFEKAGEIPRFIEDYEFRPLFLLIAGSRLLKKLDVDGARGYLRRALREKGVKLTAAALLAKSYIPRTLLKTWSTIRTRFLLRRWTRSMSDDILSFLASRASQAERRRGTTREESRRKPR